jgi:ribonuclease T1
MKKIAPLLAVTALLLAGCGNAPAKIHGGKRQVSVAEAPPCVPSADILPGKGFAPAVDAVHAAAITALLSDIAACVPLRYEHDAIVFGNREGRLPRRPEGYYREYTLAIPGRKIGAAPEAVSIGTWTWTTGDTTSVRGPERLVIGGGKQVFYSPDHYLHFAELQIIR